MRTLPALFFLLLISSQSFAQDISIRDAAKDKKIEYTLTGSYDNTTKSDSWEGDGFYFGKCMTLKMRNITKDTLYIDIENGLMLMCDDTTTQDMVVTKPMYVHLNPQQNKTVQLYAMCSEIHDGAPNKQKKYKIGQMARKSLVAITTVINAMFLHNIAGQGAVWAYTDKVSKEKLIEYGATNTTLKLTRDILNMAGVITRLNAPAKTKKAQPKDTVPAIAVRELTNTTSTSQQVSSPPINVVNGNSNIPDQNNNTITLNAYVVYSGIGAIVLLLGTTLFLAMRQKKDHHNNTLS